jgi:Holliday junction resolvase RusA-like endonuclease
MTFMVNFTVYGEPVAKARPRFTRQGRTYTPKKTHDYESEVAMMAKAAIGASPPLETPVAVHVYVTFPVPQSYSKKRRDACLNGSELHTKKPDLDNVVKSITDGMNGVIYADDSQIVSIHAKKVWGVQGMVEVLVKEDIL